VPVESVRGGGARASAGVNDRKQLAELERFFQRRQAERLMQGGATLLDPGRVDVRGAVTTGKDVLIDVNVVFEGRVRLGDRVRIGPFCVLKDAVIGDDVEILSHCRIESAEVGAGAQLGPFARLRPGARLAAGVAYRQFCRGEEVQYRAWFQVNHLTYIGDAEIGADVNVGPAPSPVITTAPTKHKTVIGDGAFIGSNSSLVRQCGSAGRDGGRGFLGQPRCPGRWPVPDPRAAQGHSQLAAAGQAE